LEDSAPFRRQPIDWLFAFWLCAEILAVFLFFWLPLLLASLSLLTRLRRSRNGQVTLWVVAVVVTFAALAPFLVIWMGGGTTTIEEHRFVVG
jgi:uncharacterized membrane protein